MKNTLAHGQVLMSMLSAIGYVWGFSYRGDRYDGGANAGDMLALNCGRQSNLVYHSQRQVTLSNPFQEPFRGKAV